jgi:hypothetical protein
VGVSLLFACDFYGWLGLWLGFGRFFSLGWGMEDRSLVDGLEYFDRCARLDGVMDMVYICRWYGRWVRSGGGYGYRRGVRFGIPLRHTKYWVTRTVWSFSFSDFIA